MLENQRQPVILALESGGDASSAALYLPSGKVVQALSEAKHGHAERLASQVEQVIKTAELDFNDITHIAAGCGPGSFTGIRVCLAAATGLLLAGEALPAGVHMLEALLIKTSATQKDKTLLAVLDSRRRSVYARLSTDTADLDLDEAHLHKLLSEHPDVEITGVLPEGWADNLPDIARYKKRLPTAELVAEYVVHQMAQNLPLNPLQAVYLAPPKLGPTPSKP